MIDCENPSLWFAFGVQMPVLARGRNLKLQTRVCTRILNVCFDPSQVILGDGLIWRLEPQLAFFDGDFPFFDLIRV